MDLEDPCSTYKSNIRDHSFSEELLDRLPFPTVVMLLLAGLAPLVVLATGVVAASLARDSLITVPISKRINFNGMPDLAKRDREHLRNLVKRGVHQRQSSTVNKVADIPLSNPGGIYVATVSVGDPPTSCEFC